MEGPLARDGTGPSVVIGAFASQVHPVFMLPAVAAALLGGLLPFAPESGRRMLEFNSVVAGLHTLTIFLAVYTAHVKDGYVDFHRRNEDDDHPLTVTGCRVGLVAGMSGFILCLIGLWLIAPTLGVVLTVPTVVIAYLHAPQLDRHPIGATLGYPIGIALALLSGSAVQIGSLDALSVGLAAVVLVALTGVKIIDDIQDLDYDRSLRKRTVAVAIDPVRARHLADTLFLASGILVLWLTIGGPFPPGAVVAPLAFGAVAITARRKSAERATMLLIRGAYVLLALLVTAFWFRPLARVPLPDIGILGPSTYLATELFFGGIALLLLLRAGRGALWRAARTIAVLYPLAYVWDWYTLSIGVFTIPLRTGVELVGLPLEEHLFALVVPALVISVHETLSASAE